MSIDQFMANPYENIRLMIRGVDPDSLLWMRGLYAPFCHVIWSAIAAGAFWHVMSKRENEPDRKSWDIDITAIADKLTFGLFKYSMNFSGAANGETQKNHLNMYVFADYRFWAIFVCPVLLHAFWNSPVLASWGIIRNVGIGVAGWAIALLLLQMGIRQVRREKESLEPQEEGASMPEA
jgi:RsiW-degrading membrane proteinase PrsW (M82 family)